MIQSRAARASAGSPCGAMHQMVTSHLVGPSGRQVRIWVEARSFSPMFGNTSTLRPRRSIQCARVSENSASIRSVAGDSGAAHDPVHVAPRAANGLPGPSGATELRTTPPMCGRLLALSSGASGLAANS